MRTVLSWISVVLLAGCASTSPRPVTTANVDAGVRVEGALRYDGVPPADPSVLERLRPYLEARTASLHGWLPDGGVLISTRFGQTAQLHTVASVDAMRRQITFFQEPVLTAAVSPDPLINGLIFTRDRGGDENYQLYFQRLDTLEIKPLTDGKGRNDNPLFALEGGQYAYSSTARNGVDFDIWVGDVGNETPARIVHQAGGTWKPIAFSHDGKKLIVQNYVSILDSRLVLVDLASGSSAPLLADQRSSSNPLAKFSHDDSGVYYLSDQGSQFVGLHYLDLKSARSVWLTPFLSTEVEDFALGYEDQHIAVLDNIGGSGRILTFARSEAGTILPQPLGNVALAGGTISQLHFNVYGTDLAFVMSGAQIPGDVLSLNIATKQLARWTRNETGGLDPQAMVVPTEERAGGFDIADFGLPRQIPGWYYRPEGVDRAPVVIMVHGGPESQARPSFDPFIQFLVRELKVAVITPNVRGSSGYGRNYLSLDDGIKRGDSVKDLEAWVDWAKVRPELDGERIVVYGGSYGGFMVLAALTQFSDKIAGGVDIVGISNFISFLENTNPYRRDQRRQEYGDERDPAVRAVLQQISPLSQVDAIGKPLLVIQGANDPRVPQSEAEQMVAAVRAKGGDVGYLLAANEGHGFRKKENVDAMRVAVVMWLQSLFAAKPD